MRSHGRFPFFPVPFIKDFIAIKRLLTLLTCLSLSLALCGAEWFVFPETGKKKNPGTKAEPLKSIANAIKKAEAGDTLYLAAGLYTGAMGASEIVVDKPLIIKGGYTTDFSSQDVIADIEKNIFGLNITAGVNHAKGDAKKKKVSLDENAFFLNRKGDIDLQGGGAVLLSLKMADDEFEELEDALDMESVEENISLNKTPPSSRAASTRPTSTAS